MVKIRRKKPKRKVTLKDFRANVMESLRKIRFRHIRLPLFALLAIFVNTYFFYPKISVFPSSAWNPSNPLHASFVIKNESNIGCYEVRSNLSFRRLDIHADLKINNTGYNEIPHLCAKDETTISTEDMVTTPPNSIDYAEIYIHLKYKHPLFPYTFSDHYRFKARKTPSGYIWERFYTEM